LGGRILGAAGHIPSKDGSGSLVSAGVLGREVPTRGGFSTGVSNFVSATVAAGTSLVFGASGSGAATVELSGATAERAAAWLRFSSAFSSPATLSEVPRNSSRSARFSLASVSVLSPTCFERLNRINAAAQTTTQARNSTPAPSDYSQVK
jgi:hypothetical protein